MPGIVHARIDSDTAKVLSRLKRRRGWSDSEVVRRGIRALARTELSATGRSRIIGLGAYRSGRPDLGSDKRHLAGFGR
jgi:hypothetical protein